MANFNNAPLKLNSHYIIFLAMLYITISLIADTVAYKLVHIGVFIEPGPPFIFPLTYALGDILAEVYGYNTAKKIILLGLLCEFIFALIVYAIIHLPSPSFWGNETAYITVLGDLPRFVLAGFVAVLFSALANVYTMAKWKIALKGKSFVMRSVGSSAIGGFILVLITVALGYSGTVSFKNLMILFVSIYILEVFYAIILAWPAKIAAVFLKRAENRDAYEASNFRLNLFSFKKKQEE